MFSSDDVTPAISPLPPSPAPAPAETAAENPAQPRRTGWWAKRLLGGG
jgi:hypothetical protein